MNSAQCFRHEAVQGFRQTTSCAQQINLCGMSLFVQRPPVLGAQRFHCEATSGPLKTGLKSGMTAPGFSVLADLTKCTQSVNHHRTVLEPLVLAGGILDLHDDTEHAVLVHKERRLGRRHELCGRRP
jgi:hypothetical protein